MKLLNSIRSGISFLFSVPVLYAVYHHTEHLSSIVHYLAIAAAMTVCVVGLGAIEGWFFGGLKGRKTAQTAVSPGGNRPAAGNAFLFRVSVYAMLGAAAGTALQTGIAPPYSYIVFLFATLILFAFCLSFFEDCLDAITEYFGRKISNKSEINNFEP